MAQIDKNKEQGGAQHLNEADVDFITMETSSDSDATNNGIASEVTAKSENSSASSTTGAPAADTAASTGFFSRMQSIRSNAAPILGDVYDRAQKRAAQFREQAATEMERLRQQQVHQGKEKTEAAAISPSTGPSVMSAHGSSHSSVTDQEEMENKTKEPETEIETEVMKTSNARRINPESNNSSGAKRDKEAKLNPKSITSPIRSAFAIVRQTSQEVARDFILPPGTSFSYESNEDADNNIAGRKEIVKTTDKIEKALIESEPKSGNPEQNDSKDAENNTACEKSTSIEIGQDENANAIKNIGSTRLAAATSAVVSAYTEFRAVGRYRVMKDNEPPQNVATSHNPNDIQEYAKASKPHERSEPMVGGADRVGGLRNLQLGEIFAAFNSSVGTLPEESTNNDGEQQDDNGTNSFFQTTSDVHDSGVTIAQPTKKAKPKLRTSYYEEAVKSVLQPGQHALFFGRGTMGVILKPTYLASWRGKDGGGLLTPSLSAGSSTKKGGVYIDYLIPGGHAEKSGVVFVGDHVLKIGAIDVSNMTLEEVVKVINETKRPNIMVLTSEHDVELVTSSRDERVGCGVVPAKQNFTSPLDLAFGFVNKVAAEGVDMHNREGKAVISMKANFSSNSLIDQVDESEDGRDGEDDEDENSAEEIVLFNASGEEEDVGSSSILEPSGAIDHTHQIGLTIGEIGTKGDERACSGQSRLPTFDTTNNTNQNDKDSPITSCGSESHQGPIVSIAPASFTTSENIDTLAMYASRRTNRRYHIGESSNSFLLSMLKRALLLSPDFHQTLRYAFVECCCDPRKCNFLKMFFQSYDCVHDADDAAKTELKKGNGPQNRGDLEYSSNMKIQLQLLDLYLEMRKFRDAVGVCSKSDREQLLDFAKRISNRFLFDANDDERKGYRLPEHVIYEALGGSDEVQSVKLALSDEDQFFERDDGDGFHYIRSALEEYMSLQNSFLSFLVSDDCARMRAYLRGAAPFLSIDPAVLLKPNFDSDDESYENVRLHAILHLLCLRDNGETHCDVMYRNDAISASQGNRVHGAISILSCSVYINRTLRTVMRAAMEGLIEDGMTGGTSNRKLYFELLDSFQFLWEGFIAPGSGSLASISLSEDAQMALDSLRRRIVSSADQVFSDRRVPDCTSASSMARLLTSTEVSDSLSSLSEALIREYTLELFPKFRRHIFYEWVCKEAKSKILDSYLHPLDKSEYLTKGRLSEFNKGWLNKALRQIEFPRGLSLHRPGPGEPSLNDSSVLSSRSQDPVSLHNADVAIVFGTDIDVGSTSDFASSRIDSSKRNESFRRFACVPLHDKADYATGDCVLLTDELPATIEQYSTVPPFHARPFQGILMDQRNNRMSSDGWEISLTNFVVPSRPGNGQFLYCVSLVMSKISSSSMEKAKTLFAPMLTTKYPSEREISNMCISELVFDQTVEFNDKGKKGSNQPQCRFDFESPLIDIQSKDRKGRKMKVTADLKGFNNKLNGRKWSQSFASTTDVTIGLVLISSRNVTLAMRDTLSLLYNDFCSIRNHSSELGNGGELQYFCQPLVDILGVLASPDVEKASLTSILESYLSFSSSRWINRSLLDQSNQLVQSYGAQLTQSLPPVALALLFSTILLEQKVVLSSSRRGLLTAASHAIIELLCPLKWPHLFVPLVPVSMIDDLVHYPAPFILGIPEDEKSSADVLDSLPPDVTLVNLDFGRVILAPDFGNNGSTQPIKEPSEEAISTEKSVTAALRDQVVLLAEALGGIFGTTIHPESWCCDSAVDRRLSRLKDSQFIQGSAHMRGQADFVSISNICNNFLTELLLGIPSCCLWLEEKGNGVPNGRNETAIIFDEDRFFHLKNLRAEGRFSPLFSSYDLTQRPSTLTLSLDHFDLILESFLRTQCLSTYICSRDKCSMLFW